MTNEQLMRDILQLMELSSMEADERQMWTILVPSMEQDELIKFKGILEKEVNKMTDIYLSVITKGSKK